MRIKKRICTVAAVLVLTLAYAFCIGGCSEKNTETTVSSEEPVLSAKEDTRITVGSISCDALVQELTLTDADPSELEEILPKLSQLKKLTLEGMIPDAKSLLKLSDLYPSLELVCQINIAGVTASTDVQVLDLADTVQILFLILME